MNTLYRLHTERFDNVTEITSRYFEGFTAINVTGYWQGASEAAVIVEIYAAQSDASKVRALADEIRITNKQQAVLLSILPAVVELLDA
mgnify:CR=1 FL=1